MTLERLFAHRKRFFATRSSPGQPPCEGFVHYAHGGAQHRTYQRKIVIGPEEPQLQVF